jgi:hypothetical protein
VKAGPSDAYRQDQRIDRLEDKIENLAKSLEALHRVIADARPKIATRERPYIHAG